MKKILLLVAIFLCFISITGCNKKEELKEENKTTVVERTEEEKILLDYLTNNVLTTSDLSKNRFLLFTEDGKYLRYYGSEILFPKTENCIMISGTYEYKDNTLYLYHKKYYSYKYNEDEDKMYFDVEDDKRIDTNNNFTYVEKETNNGKMIYAGHGTFRLYKVNENVPSKLSDYFIESLKNDLEDFDIEKVKSLEEPFK